MWHEIALKRVKLYNSELLTVFGLLKSNFVLGKLRVLTNSEIPALNFRR